MNSLRIHSTDPTATTDIPYLLLSSCQDGRMTFDFNPLAPGQSVAFPQLTLSEDAVYELLLGHDLHVTSDQGDLDLIPEDADLVIACSDRKYRVSMSEIGLGWNLMRRVDRSLESSRLI